MNIEELLSRLDKVSGKHPQWQSRCPAHEDNGPSLSIATTQTHQILLHCFAGCGIDEICGALGIEIHELFPPDEWLNNRRGNQQWIEPANVLKALEKDIYLLALASGDIASNKTPTAGENKERRAAQERIIDAGRYVRRIR